MSNNSDNSSQGNAGFGPYNRKEKIPRHLDSINAQWLTGMLQNRYPGLVVENMEVVNVRNGHTTKMQVKLSFNEVGKKSGIPENVCLKANWSEGFDSGDICELEARFYHYVRDDLGVPAPRAFYSDWDGDGSGQGVVVMEDLVLEGGVFGHSTHHIGIDGVAHGLESLATLHAGWWGSAKLDQHSWLKPSMDTPIDTGQLDMMWPWAEKNIVKPEYQAFLPRWLLDEPKRFFRAFEKLGVFERQQTSPRCVVHGDSHLGNSYLRTNGERLWLDWQLVRKGRPWRDVTYFMLGSLTIEERRSAERDLLRHYRQALVAKGAQDVSSDDEIFNQYCHWPIYGMQSWIANMDEWGQIGFPMVQRFFTAAADHDTLKLLESVS